MRASQYMAPTVSLHSKHTVLYTERAREYICELICVRYICICSYLQLFWLRWVSADFLKTKALRLNGIRCDAVKYTLYIDVRPER